MFWRILSASLRRRRGRLTVATLALALGSTLAATLLNLSGDIGGRVGRELRNYGANLIIRPQEQSLPVGMGALKFGEVTASRSLAQADLEPIKRMKDVVGVVPYLYAVIEAGESPAILAGVDLPAARSVNAWWQVRGRWPSAPGEILAGRRAAEILRLAPESSLPVTYGGQTQALRISGILETGAAEDDQLIAGLADVQALASQPGRVGLIMVSALAAGRSLDAVAGELRGLLPLAEVRPLEQFAQTDMIVLGKVRLLIGLVAALVLTAGALTVAGTLNMLVIERRTEIGLLKALGAADRHVARLFLAEALSIGAMGGVFGYLCGLGLTLLIGWKVFAAAITPAVWGLPGTLLVGLGVSWLAGLLPVRRALKIDPATTLRGE